VMPFIRVISIAANPDTPPRRNAGAVACEVT
jgi:hypothetical protein